ncbi:hypothetical protein ANRL3_02550 [Anaerolineae bacterium]|nr:hypothetical protein ANRL3_02550 [Anaerolineae bacterium]
MGAGGFVLYLGDKDFGHGEFTIGYYDRIEHGLILVPLNEIAFPKEGPGVFELTDHAGTTHTIPLHRVKAVYKNGELIWHREYAALRQP